MLAFVEDLRSNVAVLREENRRLQQRLGRAEKVVETPARVVLAVSESVEKETMSAHMERRTEGKQ